MALSSSAPLPPHMHHLLLEQSASDTPAEYIRTCQAAQSLNGRCPRASGSRDFGTHSAPPSRDNCRNKQVGVSTHRPQRKLREQTAHTDRRRDNCKTNSITRQRQLQNKQHHDRRENCGSNTSTSAEKTAEQTSHILSALQLEHTARAHVVGIAV